MNVGSSQSRENAGFQRRRSNFRSQTAKQNLALYMTPDSPFPVHIQRFLFNQRKVGICDTIGADIASLKSSQNILDEVLAKPAQEVRVSPAENPVLDTNPKKNDSVLDLEAKLAGIRRFRRIETLKFRSKIELEEDRSEEREAFRPLVASPLLQQILSSQTDSRIAKNRGRKPRKRALVSKFSLPSSPVSRVVRNKPGTVRVKSKSELPTFVILPSEGKTAPRPVVPRRKTRQLADRLRYPVLYSSDTSSCHQKPAGRLAASLGKDLPEMETLGVYQLIQDSGKDWKVREVGSKVLV